VTSNDSRYARVAYKCEFFIASRRGAARHRVARPGTTAERRIVQRNVYTLFIPRRRYPRFSGRLVDDAENIHAGRSRSSARAGWISKNSMPRAANNRAERYRRRDGRQRRRASCGNARAFAAGRRPFLSVTDG